ncbi:MAG: chitobiase/beta-hexosaminidase C-terminal domain-containing protein [Clostridia bacterium]|nr:chitobiase/beta-hexosaminidase C-terminal domain-containing protein [Clostridia bacterium]
MSLEVNNDFNIVTIKTSTSGATVYYTIDGEEPSTVSEKYTEPIYLEESALLQTFAVKKGYATSEIGKEYVEIEAKKDSYEECNCMKT